MAMNKAERAELDAWKRKAALAWPTFERPEPVSEAEIDLALTRDGLFYGWWTNVHRGEVCGVGTVTRFGTSSERVTAEQLANRHKPGGYISISQGRGGPWFRDREDALKEVAWRVAEHAAEALDAAYERVRAERVAAQV